MNASRSKERYLVLTPAPGEQLGLHLGDVLVVCTEAAEQLLLRKEEHPSTDHAYLTPAPLAPEVLQKIYEKSDFQWDTVEEKAVGRERLSAAGQRLEEL